MPKLSFFYIPINIGRTYIIHNVIYSDTLIQNNFYVRITELSQKLKFKWLLA